MKITETEVTITSGANTSTIYADAEGAGLGVKGPDSRLDITPQADAVTLLARAASSDEAKPVAVLAAGFEVIDGEVSTFKTSAAGFGFAAPVAVGSATVGLGTDCPAGTITPTWVKVKVNGVDGVMPFYPL